MSGPHDLFARYTFGHPERAAAELRAVLPAHVVSEVDWSSLRREPVSVVDPELRQTESDLLFSARLRSGQPLLLYVLLEHQSSVDVAKTQTRKTSSASRSTAGSSSAPGAHLLRA
ncbi:MAG TPA: Rpn family recombination-promoting nuclease/putative transposase [Archangium sp.]|uniref:Rpn family recombination-promoting nuclease/putative transposase n=1 Tax=Archangium sp. TaxID=1872627 RepID=UPI002E34B329|nr:Rpn family recombination-promoting nuclease/putative transposase [Archangium sp.]HEX5752872.1 Rpn family recombination-promoting nuclease/putative transposase [Archangium sp.]